MDRGSPPTVATRDAGNRKIMDQAVFSPCGLCREKPEKPPLWQIKATRVIHNEARREIEYKDAVLEMYGIPVFYTPYLVHPDPTVERRSGLLTPTIGHSDQIGFIYGQPYFHVDRPVTRHRDRTRRLHERGSDRAFAFSPSLRQWRDRSQGDRRHPVGNRRHDRLGIDWLQGQCGFGRAVFPQRYLADRASISSNPAIGPINASSVLEAMRS